MHPDLDASTNYHCLVFHRNVVPQSEPGHPGQVNDWLPGFLARNAPLGTGHGNASSQQPTAGWAAPPSRGLARTRHSVAPSPPPYSRERLTTAASMSKLLHGTIETVRAYRPDCSHGRPGQDSQR